MAQPSPTEAPPAGNPAESSIRDLKPPATITGGDTSMTLESINLRYTEAGRGQPLVLLHGFPLSRGVWQKQIESFQSSYRVIAPDLRGLGESDAQPGPATMEQCAVDLYALLQRLRAGPAILIGHSMGGYVALAFASQFPEMLRGLVLVSTKAGKDTVEAAAGRRAMAEKVETDGVQVVVEAMAPKMLAAGNQDGVMVSQVRAFMAASRSAGVIAALLGMAERPDATENLAQIAAPTLVVTGADDTLIPPAESETLARAIRGAQLKVIPRAGHLVAFEQPEVFNRILKEWLSGASLGSPDRSN